MSGRKLYPLLRRKRSTMQQGGLKKIRIFLCVFESVLLGSLHLLYTFHLMTCHCRHGCGAHETGCASAHMQSGCMEASSLWTNAEILGDGVCPVDNRKSHDPATCSVCRLFAGLSRMLPSETAKLSFYPVRQEETALLPFPAVNGVKPAATPARAPPFPSVS